MSCPFECQAWMDASVALNVAAQHLRVAYASGRTGSVALAIDEIARAAELLGCRLVPIASPQQEHEALLAARLAEDGPPPVTSTPGFDGRDSSIGMREQDIEGAAV